MYFVEKILDDTFLSPGDIPKNFNKKDACFFDIETAGLSPKYYPVFLIGLLLFKDDKIIMRQYFANNKTEEIEVLNMFVEDIQYCTTIYHFNGLSFDIPYVNERLRKYEVSYQIPKEKSFDIFQFVKKYKEQLNLENLKLKSVEKYLGIYREDELSGQEVAEAYNVYVRNQDKELRDKILLHNEEDIINLYRVLPILNISNPLPNRQADIGIGIEDIFSSSENLVIKGKCNLQLDKDIEISKENCEFLWRKSDQKFILSFKVLNGGLYYIFNDYKNYYYIPEIDQAVHKSIAKYYRFEEKIQAAKETAYIKVSGNYIELPSPVYDENIKICCTSPIENFRCITLDEIEKNKYSKGFINIISLSINKIIGD